MNTSVRPAAVAGIFYPGEARRLASEVDALLGGVEHFELRLALPKVLVVPHAGYVYSGAVAAYAYDALAVARGVVKRVVVLGPAHRVPVRGLAAPSLERFATPLGEVPLDRVALDSLRGLKQVVESDAAHALEHSLEVQLPFLQRTLGAFTLVPLVVGMASAVEVAEVLERLWGGRETLIVVSTDLSHYHAYQEATRIDSATLARIESLAVDLDHDEACGATPLNGLLSRAAAKRLEVRRLAACNSGDTAGPRDRVVGYSALALYEGGAPSLDDAGEVLLGIARAAIGSALDGTAMRDRDEPWLGQPGASFVTLMKESRLRGCIGSLAAARPLGLDVAENARGAAFRDPRFAPLGRDEWAQCRVEVSLLSRPRPIRFSDEDELMAKIEPGADGLILESGGRRATFLPQVWEQLPDKRRFLQELKRKAGLAPQSPTAECHISRYRVAKWKQ